MEKVAGTSAHPDWINNNVPVHTGKWAVHYKWLWCIVVTTTPVAAVPPNVTPVAPVKLVPPIVTGYRSILRIMVGLRSNCQQWYIGGGFTPVPAPYPLPGGY